GHLLSPLRSATTTKTPTRLASASPGSSDDLAGVLAVTVPIDPDLVRAGRPELDPVVDAAEQHLAPDPDEPAELEGEDDASLLVGREPRAVRVDVAAELAELLVPLLA